MAISLKKQYDDCCFVKKGEDPCEYAIQRRYLSKRKYQSILEEFNQSENLAPSKPKPP
jgi:hypothetical protein